MKKILWGAALLLALSLASGCECENVSEKKLTEEQSGWVYPGLEHYHSTYGNGDYNNLYVRKFTYEGHKYIRFQLNDGSRSGMVHDPNCPCFKGSSLVPVTPKSESTYPSLWD